MKLYKAIFSIVIILIFVLSCQPSFLDQYYKKIQGGWAIEIIEYNEEYLLGYNEKDRSNLYFAPNLYLYLDKGIYLIDKSRQDETFYKGKIETKIIDGETIILLKV